MVRRITACNTTTGVTDAPVAAEMMPWRTGLEGGPDRRADVVGVFVSENSVLRLSGAVLLEMHDEWPVAGRCYLSASSLAKLYETGQDDKRNAVS